MLTEIRLDLVSKVALSVFAIAILLLTVWRSSPRVAKDSLHTAVRSCFSKEPSADDLTRTRIVAISGAAFLSVYMLLSLWLSQYFSLVLTPVVAIIGTGVGWIAARMAAPNDESQ